MADFADFGYEFAFIDIFNFQIKKLIINIKAIKNF